MTKRERQARDLQQVQIRMPTDLHDAVKAAAYENDLTMAQFIRALLRRELNSTEATPSLAG